MRAAYKEKYYNPNFGSMLGSVCSFGISAACGANMSERTVPEKVWYESREKDFEYTFSCETSHGMKFGSVTGDGSYSNVRYSNNNKTVTFTMKSTGSKNP